MNGERLSDIPLAWDMMRTIVKNMTKMEIALLKDLIAFKEEEEE